MPETLKIGFTPFGRAKGVLVYVLRGGPQIRIGQPKGVVADRRSFSPRRGGGSLYRQKRVDARDPRAGGSQRVRASSWSAPARSATSRIAIWSSSAASRWAKSQAAASQATIMAEFGLGRAEGRPDRQSRRSARACAPTGSTATRPNARKTTSGRPRSKSISPAPIRPRRRRLGPPPRKVSPTASYGRAISSTNRRTCFIPAEFARRTSSLRKLGVVVEVLDVPAMRKLGMGALLGVAQGSAHEPKLVVMRWNGGKRGADPIAFIGKGVCFDSGGISIKPAAGMEDMKGDMAGAACVVGLMHALAARKAKVNVVGVIGLVENMPDGKAQRPGRYRHLDVGADHRNHQHRCRGAARARRRCCTT